MVRRLEWCSVDVHLATPTYLPVSRTNQCLSSHWNWMMPMSTWNPQKCFLFNSELCLNSARVWKLSYRSILQILISDSRSQRCFKKWTWLKFVNEISLGKVGLIKSKPLQIKWYNNTLRGTIPRGFSSPIWPFSQRRQILHDVNDDAAATLLRSSKFSLSLIEQAAFKVCDPA